jgi:protein gp37
VADTSIEWTHREGTKGVTWNPTTGCDRISAGCDNCYALTLAKRLKGMGSAKYQNDGDPRTSGPGFGLTIHPDVLSAPLHWRQPRTVFVNSMSDLFHARVPREFVARVFAVMAMTPRHTYQALTKRPERMARMLADDAFCQAVMDRLDLLMVDAEPYTYPQWPLPNVWLGTSIESDDLADRADALQRASAAVRFISAEPLLGPLPSLDLAGIDWLIAGGESGPNARPVEGDWIRDLRDRCLEAGTAFFFKQWGGRTPKAGGRELDSRTWDEYPQPCAEAATR